VHRNAPQRTALHRTAPQRTATHRNTPQHTHISFLRTTITIAGNFQILQQTAIPATHRNAPQRTATHRNTQTSPFCAPP